ncbi:MAG: hypothetical protein GXO48_09090 [Chlorobi bacterium]|nr:hypothetical protein [Chlorobiota bacterium]
MKHFNRLFLREWHLRLRWYTIGGVGIAIILGLLNVGFESIVGLLLLLGLAYPLRFLWEWRHSSYSAVEYITLPVSMSEKWFVRWHIMTLWMPAVFFISGFAGETIADVIYEGTVSFSLNGNTLWGYLLTWWILSGVFAIGSLFFRRYTLIKTLGIMLMFFLLLHIVGTIAIDWDAVLPYLEEMGGVIKWISQYTLSFAAFWAGVGSISGTATAYILLAITIGWIWLITWYRFKEIEA